MVYTSVMPNPSSQSGGIFFYIIIGIVLFAALGYAVSRNTIKTDFVSDEKARLYASEIMNFGNQLNDGMRKLQLRGCKADQYNFANSVYKTISNGTINSSNSNAPSDKTCNLFEAVEGGNITPYVVPEEALLKLTSSGWNRGHGGARIRQVTGSGTDGAAGTASANDIIFTLSFISTPVCKKINDLLGVPNPSGSPPAPTQTGTAGMYTNGSFTSNAVISNPGGAGFKAFCFSSPPENIFLQVLLAR